MQHRGLLTQTPQGSLRGSLGTRRSRLLHPADTLAETEISQQPRPGLPLASQEPSLLLSLRGNRRLPPPLPWASCPTVGKDTGDLQVCTQQRPRRWASD